MSMRKKRKHFIEKQEVARKDVEHAFWVLQELTAIICGAARFFKLETLKDIMMACIILHNMIIEDECHLNGVESFDYEQVDGNSHDPMSHNHTTESTEFIGCHLQIRDKRTHSQLQSNLVEHLWQLHSKS